MELNTTLLRVNNFDIKQKNDMKYLFYDTPQTPNEKLVNTRIMKAQNNYLFLKKIIGTVRF